MFLLSFAVLVKEWCTDQRQIKQSVQVLWCLADISNAPYTQEIGLLIHYHEHRIIFLLYLLTQPLNFVPVSSVVFCFCLPCGSGLYLDCFFPWFFPCRLNCWWIMEHQLRYCILEKLCWIYFVLFCIIMYLFYTFLSMLSPPDKLLLMLAVSVSLAGPETAVEAISIDVDKPVAMWVGCTLALARTILLLKWQARLLNVLRKSCAHRICVITRHVHLSLVTFRILLSTCVASPLTAFGSSISPWLYSACLIHIVCLLLCYFKRWKGSIGGMLLNASHAQGTVYAKITRSPYMYNTF